MRILLVKLSSLGDVVHNLPVASDIRRAFPDATIDWVTEAQYAPLVALHPAIHAVFPVHLRALKKAWWQPSRWSLFFDDKARLAAQRYDAIIDTQGLVKSALVARWANGPIAGFDRTSVREPFATHWYRQIFAVAREQHAVVRNRALAAGVLKMDVTPACDYGLVIPASAPTKQGQAIAKPYVVLMHATSRPDKTWPVASWVTLGRALNDRGWQVVLLSGNVDEHRRSGEIAAGLANARAVEAMPLNDVAVLLAGAHAVVGVDTGLAHLAVALNRPTVGIYLTTRPALTGLYDGTNPPTRIISLGGGSVVQPAHVSVDAVIDAVDGVVH